MKTLSLAIVSVFAFVTMAPAFAKGAHSGGSHSISGYSKSNGTRVAPSHATNPNRTRADNYSTKGNVNPYTGKAGTKN